METNSDNDLLKLQISGMTCAACSARIEKVLRRVDGIHEVNVNLAVGSASVQMDSQQITEKEIIQRIEQLGYGASKRSRSENTVKINEIRLLKIKFIISACLTLPLFWSMARHYSFSSGIWIPDLFLNAWFQWALATLVQVGIGLPFYLSAYQALRNRSPNMDVLIVLSTSCAYLFGHYLIFHPTLSQMHASVYFETSAMILTVILLGKLLEALVKGSTLAELKHLHQLQARSANVIRNKQECNVSIESIEINDYVIVRPNERIPVDGQVVEGSSAVDEALITGESMPVEKQVRDQVVSGGINLNGILIIKVSRIGEFTALAKMISLVEGAQATKPPIQRTADRIAEVFVPIVMGLALLTFITWSLWLEAGNYGGALQKAIAILVVACPCALGLATPTSILVGSGKAAAAGILFKEGKHMEWMQQMDIILLDKTGTVTRGKPDVKAIFAHSIDEAALLRISAAAEQHSEHPLAQAIVREAQRKGIRIPDAVSFSTSVGYGVFARVEGQEVRIGSRKYMKQQDIVLVSDNARIHQFEREGNTVLFAAINGEHIGMLVIADPIKASSKQAIERLKQAKRQVMLVTGDNARTAKAIAQEAGIYRIYAEMLPSDKVALIKQMQSKGKKVAMVGDGINDAPALAAANLGIAIATGSDITKEAADINLLHSDLNGVIDAINISKQTIRNIRQNLGFAFIYNFIAIPFAYLGWLEPWMAGTAMALSSVTVVGNALRLKNK